MFKAHRQAFRSRITISTAATVCAALLAPAVQAEERAADCASSARNWPGWRGDGSGKAAQADAPLRWDAENGIAWKTRLPGSGNGSPIIWGDRAYLTAATEGGRVRLVICLDAQTGQTLWQRQIPAEATRTYPRSGHAAPTPLTDGQMIYAFFDSPGLIALDNEGTVRWQVELGPFSNPYNMASSPVLCGKNVVMNCDHQGESFIAAFDRATGDEQWRTPRDGGLHYATPFAFTHDGQKQLVVNAQKIVSYDPDTGEELWSCEGMKHATTPSAMYHDGFVYATSGRNGPSKIIDPSGRGDITETHVLVHLPTGGPYVPSPLVHKGLFFVPGDDGRIMIVNLEGRKVLRDRVRARFTTSPVAAGDHIYWVDEKARTYVLDASGLTGDSPRLEQIAENALEEEPVYSSPALADGKFYVRTAKHLYCITGGDARLATPRKTDLPDDFDQLKAFYMPLPKGEHDDTMLRLEIVEKLVHMDHPQVPDFLAEIVEVDAHWDVTEAAVRELGQYGQRAVPVLIDMFKKGQPFYKTVAAEHLAELKAPEAVPALIGAAKNNERQVRIASIQALGHTATANEAEAPQIAMALVELMDDSEGLVRHASIEALTMFADKFGPNHDTVLNAARGHLADPNSLVSRAAAELVARLET